MSLPDSTEIICGNCLNKSEHFDWVSTNSFGSSDLDTRPPGDLRFTMKAMYLKKCPVCKYCYVNITKISDEGRSTLQKANYLAQADDPTYPDIANGYLCQTLILEAEGKIVEAAWSSLQAAWCCDDLANSYIQAKNCRIRAIELFQIAKNIGLPIYENEGDYVCLLVDLNRKTENLEVAKRLATYRLNIESNELCKKILYYQIDLCNSHDLVTHSIDEAIKFYDANWKVNGTDNDSREDYNRDDNYENQSDIERDYFDAMTDGQLGDFDDFKSQGGNIDDL